jgi:hypothetical protein
MLQQGEMMMRRSRYFLLPIALVASTSVGAAKNAPIADRTGSQLVVDVTACRGITDSAARLACYDGAVAKLADATARKDVVVLDREDVQKTKRSLFGFNLPKLALFGDKDGQDKPDKSEREEFTEITAKIQSARVSAVGQWTLALDDGSVWETREAPNNDPRSGDTIRIRKAALSSYFGNIAGQRAVRIHRIE